MGDILGANMNVLGKIVHRKNNLRQRNGGIGLISLVVYGVLTLVIIWTAALSPNLGNISLGLMLLPLLVSLFLLVLGVVFLRSRKNRSN